jgi:hypothetical protein
MFYRSCPCLSFQHGHLSKYRRLGCSWSERETRSEFELFSEQGMNWILEELQLARPKVVIALGSEVIGILQYVGGQTQRNELLGGDIKEFCAGFLFHLLSFLDFSITVLDLRTCVFKFMDTVHFDYFWELVCK